MMRRITPAEYAYGKNSLPKNVNGVAVDPSDASFWNPGLSVGLGLSANVGLAVVDVCELCNSIVGCKDGDSDGIPVGQESPFTFEHGSAFDDSSPAGREVSDKVPRNPRPRMFGKLLEVASVCAARAVFTAESNMRRHVIGRKLHIFPVVV